jgi:tetratricopeptide (TPR) repeat protein
VRAAGVVTIAFALMSSTIASALPRCEGKLLRSQIGERQEVTLRLLRAKSFDRLQERVDGFLNAYVKGTLTDEELLYEFEAFQRDSPALTPLFSEWVQRYPKSFAAYHGMSLHLSSIAWQTRGSALAKDTSVHQMDEFHRLLREARDWSLRSITLHPKPILAYQQLMSNAMAMTFDVALPGYVPHHLGNLGSVLSMSNPRLDVLPILEESLRIQPDNTIVREAYVTVLAPRWGGSLKALWKFSEPATHRGLASDRIATVTYAAMMEIASDYRFRERDEEAIPIYERAAKICRLNQPFVDIANIRLRQKRYREALAAAESVLGVVPNSSTGLRLKANALFGLGRHEELTPLLLRLAPEGAGDVQYMLGEAYLNGSGGLKKDPVEARRLMSLSARAGVEKATKRLEEIDGHR